MELQCINTWNKCNPNKVFNYAKSQATTDKKNLQLSPFTLVPGHAALKWSSLSHLQRQKRFDFSHSFTISSTNKQKKVASPPECLLPRLHPPLHNRATTIEAQRYPLPGSRKKANVSVGTAGVSATCTYATAPPGCRWSDSGKTRDS